jgi:hypothetical protein
MNVRKGRKAYKAAATHQLSNRLHAPQKRAQRESSRERVTPGLELRRKTGPKKGGQMEAKVDEIADGVYRLSAYVPDIAPPAGFTFNHFLVLGDEPLLFHTGLRRMFPVVRAAVEKVLPAEKLRWICFGHYEADECGSMNEWLAVAPRAEVMHGQTGNLVSLNDMADRAPRVLANDEVVDLGRGKRVRYIDTPHIPHGWDAGVLHEESTGTLLCGDLFTQLGDGPALTSGDIVGPRSQRRTCSAIRVSIRPWELRSAASHRLPPARSPLMHGPSYAGDGAAALRALADDYDRRVRQMTT